MAEGVSARLSPAEGRRFGLVVGVAFLALSGVLMWRGHEIAASIVGAWGGLLALAGVVVPTRLGPVQRTWLGLAMLLSRFTTPLFMGIVYFAVVAPIGLLVRLLGRNPVIHTPVRGSFWAARGDRERRSSLERQF